MRLAVIDYRIPNRGGLFRKVSLDSYFSLVLPLQIQERKRRNREHGDGLQVQLISNSTAE